MLRVLPPGVWIGLALLGAVLTATVVPGAFTIDENNYLVSTLALRDGGVALRNTVGLPPSSELRYFDPVAAPDALTQSVASTAPPLYGILALPFSWFGWRGLVALNTLAYLATIAIVFAHARRGATQFATPWLAAATAAFGGYFFEYAQGVWPHMLSVALVSGAALLVGRALDDAGPERAALGGFLAALAAGVRYQNAFVLACFGVALLCFARQRLRVVAALVLGAALPLLASASINHARIASWNPMSKGANYVPQPVLAVSTADGTSFGDDLGGALVMAWARVVDYTARPPFPDAATARILSPDPDSGAYQIVTAVKKAWLQSAPWMVVPLVVLFLVWLPGGRAASVAGAAGDRQLRALSLVVFGSIALFSSRGPLNTSGLCFNQRYFCELVPLLAVVLAWGVEALRPRWRGVLAGAVGAGLVAFAALQLDPDAPLRHRLLMRVPLLLAGIFALTWSLARWRVRAAVAAGDTRPAALGGMAMAFAIALGACLGWALAVHLGDDLPASREVRGWRAESLRALAPLVPDRAAVIASGAAKDALGALQLDRDVVVVAPDRDEAMTTRILIDAFFAQGRRVFLIAGALPKERIAEVLAGLRLVRTPAPRLAEVRAGGNE